MLSYARKRPFQTRGCYRFGVVYLHGDDMKRRFLLELTEANGNVQTRELVTGHRPTNEMSLAISFEAGMFSPFDLSPVTIARQSPAKLWGRTPVILPAASKPNNKVVASPRGKINFTI